jgi:hypothetical protein
MRTRAGTWGTSKIPMMWLTYSDNISGRYALRDTIENKAVIDGIVQDAKIHHQPAINQQIQQDVWLDDDWILGD